MESCKESRFDPMIIEEDVNVCEPLVAGNCFADGEALAAWLDRVYDFDF